MSETSEKVFDSNQGKMVDKNEPLSTEPVEVQIARQNYALFVSINSSLKSIKSSMTFFVVIAVIILVITLVNSCGSFLGLK